jgi:nucleotide-binding universal stress UspA family protein
MQVKVLVPLDGSPGSQRAVDYCARVFAPHPGAEIRMLHILAGLPPAMWDDGHILNERERENRQRLIENWKGEQEQKWTEIFAAARQKLSDAGMVAEQVSTLFVTKYFDVADDILKEAAKGAYDTIVLGRRGLTGAKKVLLGSISRKVLENASNAAIIIVD